MPEHALDGIILCDKPAGRTSHDVVAATRRLLPAKTRVGHAGTLDPFATGLLIVLVGRATRAQRFFMELPKAYWTRARFGWTSTTGDPEGELTQTDRVPVGDLDLPTGRVRQHPPAYSAVKVGGERAYARARRGEEVETAERVVTVQRFDEIARAGAEREFQIECSSGTYVRSLISALGDAYCLELRRTAIGPFSVDDAVEHPDPGALVPLADALGFMPAVELDADAGRRAGHGRAVPGDADGFVRLVDPAGLVAIAQPLDDGMLKPVVGFRG
jgi:tRNA pseudouridine55 synthase